MLMRRPLLVALALGALLAAALPAHGQIISVEVEPVTPGAPGPKDTYRAGQTFALRYVFVQTLPDVSGAGITADLTVGAAARRTDVCVGDAQSLICPYTVGTTDQDDDGIDVGGIRDPRSVLQTTILPDGYKRMWPEHMVDGVSVDMTKIVIQSSADPNREVYRAGDVIWAEATFSEDVAEFGDFAPMLVPGRPMLPAESGDRMRTYTHRVQAGEDVAKLEVVGLWRPDDVQDEHGNRGIHMAGVPGHTFSKLEYSPGSIREQAIDTVAPSVTGIRLRTAQSLFGGGEDIEIVVGFDEDITLTGDAYLLLHVGSRVKRLRSGTREGRRMVFVWTPGADEEPIEGNLRVPERPFFLPSGSAITDVAGNPAELAFAAQDLGARVDTKGPLVRGFTVRGPSTVKEGTVVRFDVTFDEAIEVARPTVMGTECFPHISLTVNRTEHEACYVGTSARTATFAWVVDSTTVDTVDFVEVEFNELVAAGDAQGTGRLTDAAGNLGDDDGFNGGRHRLEVDSAAPAPEGNPPTLHTDKRIYAAEEPIYFTLAFDQEPTSDAPGDGNKVVFYIGGCMAEAGYQGPVGGFAYLFKYTYDSEHQCATRSGAITWKDDAFKKGDTDVSVALHGSGRAAVDAVKPTVTDARIESKPRTAASGEGSGQRFYGRGERIDIAVTFSEPVQAGCAVARLEIGGLTRNAEYLSGTGSARLRFSYRVVGGDNDFGGISVPGIAPTDPSCAAADLAGNPVSNSLGRHQIVNDGEHPVDGTLRFVAERPPVDAGDQDDPADGGDDTGDTGDTGTDAAPTGRLLLAPDLPRRGSDGSFGTGDTIIVRAEFAAPGVDVITPLKLELDIGGESRLITCTGLGRSRTSVECRYRVRPGDEAREGAFVRIASGTIRSGGVDIVPDITALDPPAVRVDAQPPALVSVHWNTDPGADETYIAGDEIGVEVTFSEPVSASELAQLPLRVGRALRRARQTSPAANVSATRFEFRYTIVAGDDDSDGMAVPVLGAGSFLAILQDAAGHEAVLAHAEVRDDPLHKVDTLGPEVTDIGVVDPPGAGAYGEDAIVTLAVTFNEAVTVATAGASLAITVGASAREAGYVAGSGTDRLTFDYEVRGGDGGALAVSADGLRGVTDIGGNPARGNARLPLNVLADTTVPSISGLPRLASAPEGGVYGVGDEIAIVVAFSERVRVTRGATGPSLRFAIGGQARIAAYAGGEGTAELRFVYVVAEGDEGAHVAVAADALSLGDGAIRDALGIAAVVRHPAMPALEGHRVDGVAPRLRGARIVSRPQAEGAYLAGERIVVEVAFVEPVFGIGRAALRLALGDYERSAECVLDAAAAEAVTCDYTVALGDFDGNGVAIVADSFDGAFADMAGNQAVLALDAVPDDPLHLVHAAPPELVTGVPAVRLVAGGTTRNVDLAGVFRGRLTRVTATSDNERVVAVATSPTALTLQSGIEGTATVTLTAINRAGREETGFAVEVVTDPAETEVLEGAVAAIGRSALSGTTDLIGARFRLAGDVSSLSLGGRRFTAAIDDGLHDWAVPRRSPFDSGGPLPAAGRQPPILGGSGFDLRLSSRQSGVHWSLWGGADLHGIDGEPEQGEYDGDGMTGAVGIDARGGTVVAGIAVVRSTADAEYRFAGETEGDGTLETTITGFHPYARLSVSEDTELWVIAGFGTGEATVEREHLARAEMADLNMAMGAAGLRRALGIDFGGARFALQGDAAFMSIGSDEGRQALDGLALGVSRLRFGLESSWQMGAVAPFANVAARFDGGDGDSTGGVELAGGVRIGDERLPFGLEARGRVLAVPFGDGRVDSGISIAAAFEPGRLGRGFWLRVAPRWGASAFATDPFGDAFAAGMHTHAAYRRSGGWGVDAALGYGMGLRRLPGLVTPFVESASGTLARRLRGGVRYRSASGGRPARIEFAVERSDGPLPESRALIAVYARL